MSQKANTTAIGAFVVGAVLLAIAAVVMFGSGRYFTKKYRYVIYFQGDVKGLNVGAPVLFRGVKVGQVTDIIMEFDAKAMQFRIPVVVEIAAGETSVINKEYYTDIEKASQEDVIIDLINRGLKAQLSIQSFITGLLYVKLDFFPEKQSVILGVETLDSDLNITEIPAIPSDMEELSRTFENIPLEKIARNLEEITHSIERLVNSSQVPAILSSIDEAAATFKQILTDLRIQLASLSVDLKTVIKDTNRVVRNINSQVDPITQGLIGTTTAATNALQQVRETFALEKGPAAELLADLKNSFKTATSALEQANQTLETIEDLSDKDSEIIYTLNTTLEEIALAARSIRTVADYLERHPESLLRGKGGNGGN